MASWNSNSSRAGRVRGERWASSRLNRPVRKINPKKSRLHSACQSTRNKMLVPHFHTRRFLQTQRLPFHPRNRSLHLFSFLFFFQIFHVALNQQRYQIFALNTLLSDTKPCFHIIKCSISLLYRLFDLSGRRAGTFTY
mgnify:CR=1 FL=1